MRRSNSEFQPPAAREKKGGTVGLSRRTHQILSESVTKRRAAIDILGGVNVDVYVRCRPLLEQEQKTEGESVVTVDPNTNSVDLASKPGRGATESFEYDQVFGPETTQQELFDAAVKPVAEQVLRGMNCCIFAYGQTGAGKSYTIFGEKDDPEKYGILPRAAAELITKAKERSQLSTIRISYMELYNEQLEDLLDADLASPKNLRVVDAPKKRLGTIVHGLTEAEVGSLDELLGFVDRAEERVHRAETKMNKQSNRAHRIFSIIVTMPGVEKAEPREGVMTLVDLAGSESIGRSKAEGKHATEAKNINRSLLTLGRVINALAQNDPHVPYRDSKLTRITQEALGGACKTAFIGNISPTPSSLAETKSTLLYCQNARAALNISQLPKWRQQDIIIRTLEAKLDEMSREMQERGIEFQEALTRMRREKLELDEENARLRGKNIHFERVATNLLTESKALKEELKTLGRQADRLQRQRIQLRDRLADTLLGMDAEKKARLDVFHKLGLVRETRNVLLEAHQETETQLQQDVARVKQMLTESAKDCGKLHEELQSKKKLIQTNEGVSETMRDSVHKKINTISSALASFSRSYLSNSRELRGALSGVTLRQSEGLESLNANINKLDRGIEEHVTMIKDALYTQTNQAKAGWGTIVRSQMSYLEQFRAETARWQESISARLQELSSELRDLDASRLKMRDRLLAKLNSQDDTIEGFVRSLDREMGDLRSMITSLNEEHQTRLSELKASIESKTQKEKATVSASADKLLKGLKQHMDRTFASFVSDVKERMGNSAQALAHDTAQIADEVQSSLDSLNTRAEQLLSSNKLWTSRTAALVKESKEALEDSAEEMGRTHKAAEDLHAASGKAIESALQDLTRSVGTNIDGLKETVAEAESDLEKKATTLEDQVTDKQAQNQRTVAKFKQAMKEMRQAIQDRIAAGEAKVEEMEGQVSKESESNRKDMETINDEMAAWWTSKLQRDTRPLPPLRKWEHGREAPSTPGYSILLQGYEAFWDVERKILIGEVRPGEGIDYTPVDEAKLENQEQLKKLIADIDSGMGMDGSEPVTVHLSHLKTEATDMTHEELLHDPHSSAYAGEEEGDGEEKVSEAIEEEQKEDGEEEGEEGEEETEA